MFGDSVQYMSLHDNVDPLLCQFETYYNLLQSRYLIVGRLVVVV